VTHFWFNNGTSLSATRFESVTVERVVKIFRQTSRSQQFFIGSDTKMISSVQLFRKAPIKAFVSTSTAPLEKSTRIWNIDVGRFVKHCPQPWIRNRPNNPVTTVVQSLFGAHSSRYCGLGTFVRPGAATLALSHYDIHFPVEQPKTHRSKAATTSKKAPFRLRRKRRDVSVPVDTIASAILPGAGDMWNDRCA
jgi:hypothetical protein